MQLSRAVGGGGLLPPTLAAWLPNMLAAIGAVWLLKRAQT
jgi:lipopolysaccharide export LptBFGC system permease protein LptF